MVTHHSAKFNSRRFCGSRDITYLIYHVTLQDHEIKRFCDITEESSSIFRTILPSLVAIATVVV